MQTLARIRIRSENSKSFPGHAPKGDDLLLPRKGEADRSENVREQPEIDFRFHGDPPDRFYVRGDRRLHERLDCPVDCGADDALAELGTGPWLAEVRNVLRLDRLQ